MIGLIPASDSESDYYFSRKVEPGGRLNRLNTILRYPCRGLNPIIDSFQYIRKSSRLSIFKWRHSQKIRTWSLEWKPDSGLLVHKWHFPVYGQAYRCSNDECHLFPMRLFLSCWLPRCVDNSFNIKQKLETLYVDHPYMGRDMTKPTKWVWAQRSLRSTWASAQSYQSLPSED